MDDIEADFLVLYRIDDPWSLSAPKFFRLARRTVFYQGSMQYRVMEIEEEQQGPRQQQSQSLAQDEKMRHNMAAAKAAGKGLKDQEVQYVPLSVFMNMAGADGEYVRAGA